MQEKWLEVEEIVENPKRSKRLRFKGSSQGHRMYINTKRSIFAFVGTSMSALALVLTLVGVQYDAITPTGAEALTVQEVILRRATPIWCGILLVLFGVRNLTLGGAVWRYRGYGCSDVCEAVLVNLLALLTAGGCLGIIIWDAVNTELFTDINASSLSHEFVKFTTIAFILTLEMLWAAVGCIVACIPIKQERRPIDSERALDNHAFE